jgi:hypothetical protein
VQTSVLGFTEDNASDMPTMVSSTVSYLQAAMFSTRISRRVGPVAHYTDAITPSSMACIMATTQQGAKTLQ